MKISEYIYNQLLNLPFVPPETGGILGGRGRLIDHMVLDTEGGHANGSYTPAVSFLNRSIHAWRKRDICFYGIFHTHLPNWIGLSQADVRYINSIMLAMPQAIDKLYFPIVHPTLSIESYMAKRVGNKVHIIHDDIEIIKGGERYVREMSEEGL